MELKTLTKMDTNFAWVSDDTTEEEQMKVKEHERRSASSTLLQRLDKPQSKLIFLVQFRPYKNTRHLNIHHLILDALRQSCTSMLLSDASYHLPTVEYVTMVIWPQSYFVPHPFDLMTSSSADRVGKAKYGSHWCCLHMYLMLTNFYKKQAPIPHLKITYATCL